MNTIRQHTTKEYLSVEDIAEIYFDELEYFRCSLQQFIRSESNLIFQLSTADMKDVTTENSRFNKNITFTKHQKAKMYYNLYNNVKSKDKESIRRAIREELKKEICKVDKVNFYELYTRCLTTLAIDIIIKAQDYEEMKLASKCDEIQKSKIAFEVQNYVKANDVAYKNDLLKYFEIINKNSFAQPSLDIDRIAQLNRIANHIKKTHDLKSYALKKVKDEVTYELRVADDSETRYVKKSA